MDISRRDLIAGAGATLALAAAPGMAARERRDSGPAWYRNAVIIDGLGGIGDPYAPEDQLRFSDRARTELLETGVTAVNMTITPVGNDPDIWTKINQDIDLWGYVIAANPDFLVPIRKAGDLQAAKAAGKMGLIFGTQDTSMVGAALDRIATLKERGVRVLQLTYNLRNLSGDGSLEPGNAGLSRLGHATIARIEAEKLLLDLSHAGARTISEGIAAATRPLTISHTGCRAVFDHPRNTSDENLKALADKGGVAGIYFMPYLSPTFKPTGAELIAHIEHMANVCGEDHVGIGSDNGPMPIPINAETLEAARKDYENRKAAGFAAPGEGPDVMTLVADYNSIDRFQRLAHALERRGWSQARLEKFFGGNLLRLYGEVWES